MTSILSINHLSKIYHTSIGETEAIKDISLNINKGEILGIVGSSGCGKSTLLNIIDGLEKQTSGLIEYNNLTIAYMLQNDALLPWLTVLDNALLGLKINHKLNKENIDYVKNLLNNFGLEKFINDYPNNLSGGMKQRVALIRTLAIKPDIILLDEPLSALDYVTRLIITDEIYNLLKKMNITTILISHDIAECVSFCDKIVVLSKRPAIIKNVYNIDLKEKNIPSLNRKDSLFNYYYDLIWGDLDKTIS
jgi:NitT/TauT family transport system ATP-binding protein